jgi:hypothetical protein
VRRNLEIGAGGLTTNHYLADVLGLLTLGCALSELREAEEWRELGAAALEREIGIQVHPDGVDFERSIPYHRLATEMFVHGALLAASAGAPPSRPYRERLGRMLGFVATYTRLDGTAPQWGDNDDGRWLPLEGYASHAPHDHRHLLDLGGHLLDRADLVTAGSGRSVERLWLLGPGRPQPPAAPAGRSSRAFAEGGYIVMRRDDLHLGVSCGAVGTRGLGNHTHNDLLALCLWADGIEWIPDPGTGVYSGDLALRNRMRSTAVHATLQLGEREQNRLGPGLDGLFHVHERARPDLVRWQSGPTVDCLVARHHGFSDDGAAWVHERTIVFRPGLRSWLVGDRLFRADVAEGAAAAAPDPTHLRFPLTPGVEVERSDDLAAWPLALQAVLSDWAAEPRAVASGVPAAFRLSAGGRTLWIVLRAPRASTAAILPGLYSPRYGVTQAALLLDVTIPAGAVVQVGTVLWSPGSAPP